MKLDKIDSALENSVVFTGILKLAFGDVSEIVSLQEKLPKNAKPLVETDLHVTLIHQKILKPFKKKLKDMKFPEPPAVKLMPALHQIVREDRQSWIVLVENQDEMQVYVNSVMKLLDEGPDPEKRVFHVTLGNLSGSPFQSVGDVKWSDIKDVG